MLGKIKELIRKIDTIDASTTLAIWVLLSDTTWLCFDIFHNGMNFGYGVVGTMFILGYIGLLFLFKKHKVEVKENKKLKIRLSKQSSLIIKQERERHELWDKIDKLEDKDQ